MAAIDLFVGMSSIDAPCTHAEAVTPSNSVDLTYVSRAIFVGGSGNLEVVTSAGETVVFNGVLSGSVLPLRVSRVKASSTTATNIVAIS